MKAINHHLTQPDSRLDWLALQIQHRQQLSATIRRCLPASLAPFCHACSLDNGLLTLYTRTATAATRLRLYSAVLLADLDLDQPVTKVRCKIYPPDTAVHPAPAASSRSPLPGKLLGSLAQTLLDPALRDIIQRLAQRDQDSK